MVPHWSSSLFSIKVCDCWTNIYPFLCILFSIPSMHIFIILIFYADYESRLWYLPNDTKTEFKQRRISRLNIRGILVNNTWHTRTTFKSSVQNSEDVNYFFNIKSDEIFVNKYSVVRPPCGRFKSHQTQDLKSYLFELLQRAFFFHPPLFCCHMSAPGRESLSHSSSSNIGSLISFFSIVWVVLS